MPGYEAMTIGIAPNAAIDRAIPIGAEVRQLTAGPKRTQSRPGIIVVLEDDKSMAALAARPWSTEALSLLLHPLAPALLQFVLQLLVFFLDGLWVGRRTVIGDGEIRKR